MRFMVIVKASKDSENGIMPDQKILEDMGKYNEELAKAGVMLAGEGLHPSSKGARIRFSKGERSVIDGPFSETKELIAGFWILQAKSWEEVLEWVKKAPFDGPQPDGQEVEIEVRQVFEDDEFGEAMTAQLKEQEARIREQASRNA